jgi:uncharacterized protein
MKRALIVWGGWMGHQPDQVADIFRNLLEQEDFQVDVSDTLESFSDAEKLKTYEMIVPVWTMGEIEKQYVKNISLAVQSGTAIAGCHGGMCDTFRNNVDWQFMTGGNWVAHPGNDGVEYVVNIKQNSNPLLEGIEDFTVKSEQYYLHVDPAVQVLATTRFPTAPGPHTANPPVDMPVVWTKYWGAGRIFYCSLGHQANIVEMPQVKEIMRRGFLWAALGKASAASTEDVPVYDRFTGMGDSN